MLPEPQRLQNGIYMTYWHNTLDKACLREQIAMLQKVRVDNTSSIIILDVTEVKQVKIGLVKLLNTMETCQSSAFIFVQPAYKLQVVTRMLGRISKKPVLTAKSQGEAVRYAHELLGVV